ncbi:MAG: hypothetical protein ACKVS6_00805 [Planctomycetota bacterium]
MKSNTRGSWSQVKTNLCLMGNTRLLQVIRDLYDASPANRRFLHARFLPAAGTLEEYRDLVVKAVFPDPLSRQPIRLRDAAAAITDYKRSTGNLDGVVDLLLTFVEAGTHQAADLGYGEDSYFSALERKLAEAASLLNALPDEARSAAAARFVQLGKYKDKIGWGFGDYLAGVAAQVEHDANANQGN